MVSMFNCSDGIVKLLGLHWEEGRRSLQKVGHGLCFPTLAHIIVCCAPSQEQCFSSPSPNYQSVQFPGCPAILAFLHFASFFSRNPSFPYHFLILCSPQIIPSFVLLFLSAFLHLS